MDLDAPERFAEVDPRDALGDVERAGAQWAAAAALEPVATSLDDVDGVCLLGMGGSGIVGDIAAALAFGQLQRPVVVHKGYGLPAWVGRRSLVLALSCSGGTEEVVEGAELACERGSRVVGVTAGGRLAALLEDHAQPWIEVPGDSPPRHSLGWLLVPTLRVLGLDAGLDEACRLLASLAAQWRRDQPMGENPPKRLAARIAGTGVLPLAFGGGPLGAVAAYRCKCQVNENAKLPAYAGALPEMDHNEVVGWEASGPLDGRAGLVWFADPAEHPAVMRRAVLTAELMGRAAWSTTVTAQGESALARLASLLLHADLVSVYAALALDRDPAPVASIAALKAALAADPAAAA